MAEGEFQMVNYITQVISVMVVIIIGVAVFVPIVDNLVVDESENGSVRSIVNIVPAFFVLIVLTSVFGYYVLKTKGEPDESTNRSEKMNPKKMMGWMKEKFRW